MSDVLELEQLPFASSDHGDDLSTWAGQGKVGGAQGQFETCAFHALGGAMDTCLSYQKLHVKLPPGSLLLQEGFPFALQAMGLKNKHGEYFSDHGGDIVTLTEAINEKDIVYAGHPQLAVHLCGQETPSVSEIKVSLTVKDLTRFTEYKTWTRLFRGVPQTEEDPTACEALRKVNDAIEHFNTICEQANYSKIEMSGGEKLPGTKAAFCVPGILVNCRTAEGDGHFMTVTHVSKDEKGGVKFHCPNSARRCVETVPNEIYPKIERVYMVNFGHPRIRTSAGARFRTFKAMHKAKQLQSQSDGASVPTFVDMGLPAVDAAKHILRKECLDFVDLVGEGYTFAELNENKLVDNGFDWDVAESVGVPRGFFEFQSELAVAMDNRSKPRVTDENVGALALALRFNTNLVWLDVSGNQFVSLSGAAGMALAEALKINNSLKKLKFDVNNLGDAAGVALAEALKTNTSLELLSLRSNKLGEETGMALAEALKTNTSLQTLYLCNNDLGEAAGMAIAEALKTNKSLQLLYLNTSNWGEAAAVARDEALKTNNRLASVWHYN